MQIFIRATGEGKAVEVFDKIANQIAYDGFLELADGEVGLEVASRDGSTGLIDIKKGASAPPNTISKSSYSVRLGEIVFISDGQD
ncbi:hypothetical protein BK661_10110 [Pseudomonas frederiksbergensis]|uniref:Uncharacterized protein n=1 Tax=Pseudomonas frederiksbergensis TaxID=104087 RepID=A0A423J9S9_9PSED|nr:hypothetical protein [Pseudomonas frederiksbergensis]RON34424.1 hypothetical protein BK661_10110 [Pseudomonas frederiksbergensis]